jgi:carbon monoxide dehydrogenase subunit G
MQLSAQQSLPVALAQAWEALNDATLLQQAIPGCDSLVPLEEHRFEVVVTAAVGPLKARYKGRLELQDLQPPHAYALRFEGQGGAAGHAKGTAQVRLEAAGPQAAVLHYSVQASVGGKLAQVGSRLVDMAAQKMAAEFFERFEAALRERYAAAPAEPPAAPEPTGLLGRLLAWLRGLFGRS